MPTKRQRRTRTKRPPIPKWATRLRDHGERPAIGSPDYDEFAAWLYFDELVSGLPSNEQAKMEVMRNANETDA